MMNAKRIWAAGILALLFCAGAGAQGPHHGGGHPFGHGLVGLISMPEVQAELRLEPAQQDLLKQFGRTMQEDARQAFMDAQMLSPEERWRKFGDLQAQQEKQIHQILDSRQWNRLRQLDLQRSGLVALARPQVQEELRLSSEQRQKVLETFTAERAASKPLFDSFRNGQATMPEQREEIRRKFDDIRVQRDNRLSAVLTESQKRQFEAMKGAPFAFPERRHRPPQ